MQRGIRLSFQYLVAAECGIEGIEAVSPPNAGGGQRLDCWSKTHGSQKLREDTQHALLGNFQMARLWAMYRELTVPYIKINSPRFIDSKLKNLQL